MRTKETPIEIKGQKEGLWIFLDDQTAIQDVLAALKHKLESSNNFFINAEVTIDSGTRELSADEEEQIRKLVGHDYSMRVKAITHTEKQEFSVDTSEAEETQELKQDHADVSEEEAEDKEFIAEEEAEDDESMSEEETEDDESMSEEETEDDESMSEEEAEDDEFMKVLDETFRVPVRRKWEHRETYSSDHLYEHEERAFYFRGTVRSGQTLEFPGNLVILGDVNAGAYIVASGDIIVMGRLHGVVHAGAEGEERAVVIGANFRPSQLRIAQYIGRSPDERPRSQTKRPQTEKAYVKDGAIVIEPIL